MTSAIQSMERPPFYYEAGAYCEKHGVHDAVQREKTRMAMAHREYTRQMQPFIDSAARLAAMLPFGHEPDAAQIQLQDQLRELGEATAKRLGLTA